MSAVFFKTGIRRIEPMSKSEQPSRPLPVDDDVVVNLPEGTQIESFGTTVFDASESSLHITSKELTEKVLEPIFDNFNDFELFEQGIKVRILEPRKEWIKGKIRLRLAFEFIPDEPDNGGDRPRSTDAVLGGE